MMNSVNILSFRILDISLVQYKKIENIAMKFWSL